MATHNGVLFQSYLAGKILASWAGEDVVFSQNFVPGTRQKSPIPGFVSETHSGLELTGVAGAVLLDDKIYVFPREFAYDLIFEEQEETITIWNADKIGHIVSNVVISGGDGIVLDYPTPPFLVTAETDLFLALTVLIDGPAAQNTAIVLQFDNGQIETITITGNRILPWPFDCDFKEVKIGYKVPGVRWENSKFHEQRRPLRRSVKREIGAQFLFDAYHAQKFLCYSREYANKVFAVPVYSEPMTPAAADLQGLSNFTVNEDLDYYWNLAESLYLLVLDFVECRAEIKEILGFSSNSVQVKYPVVDSFPRARTVIYPAAIGIVENRDFSAITDSVVTATMNFREITV